MKAASAARKKWQERQRQGLYTYYQSGQLFGGL